MPTDVLDLGVRTTYILTEIYDGFPQSPQLLIIISFHAIIFRMLTESMKRPEIHKYKNERVNDKNRKFMLL